MSSSPISSFQMENENMIVKVNIRVSNLARNLESKNIIKILLEEVLQEFIQDESGAVTYLQSYGSIEPNSHIRLYPFSLTPCHLSQLLGDQRVPYGGQLGQVIANLINHSFANDDSLRESVFVKVHVKFIKFRRVILPPVFSSPICAPREVFQRLVEEQRVESTDLEGEVICPICIENLSGNIIRMPRCYHMFHQGCLFEWLGRHNLCPLCRCVPYEDETRMLAQG